MDSLVDGFASPWVFGTRLGMVRYDWSKFPMAGVCHFEVPLNVENGSYLCAAWDLKACAALGVPLGKQLEFLADMDKADQVAWLSQHLRFSVLRYPQKLWVPQCYGVLTIAIGTAPVNQMIYQPFIAQKLAKAVDKATMESWTRQQHKFFAENGMSKTYSKITGPLKAWLNVVCPLTEVSVDTKKDKKDKKGKKDKVKSKSNS